MKFALFEFVKERSCEVGETRWIANEETRLFNNDDWVFNEEVLVEWPCDTTRALKRIVKSSVDINEVESKTYAAKIVKFSDEYDHIRQYMKQYVETGNIVTPNRGRGLRVPKRNAKYDNTEDDESLSLSDSPVKRQKKTSKKPQLSHGPSTCSSNELDILKTKYNLGAEDYGSDDEVTTLKKRLDEKNKEIKQLQSVIRNMNDLPQLHTIVKQMQAQVDCMESMQSRSMACQSLASTSSYSTPSSSPSIRAVSPSIPEEPDVEILVNEVIFCEHIILSKGQCGVLKTKRTVKDFVYSIMEMLWSREVISTHSVSGKTSNAFREKGAKPQLDQDKVSSICEYASKRFGCTQTEAKNIMRAKLNNVTKAERFRSQVKKETQ